MVLTRSDSFETSVSPEEASHRFTDYHANRGGQVIRGTDGSLEGTTGRLVWVRFLGAVFVPRSWWPLKTTVRFEPTVTGSRVEMTVSDAFGLGIRTGMTGRYEELMKIRANEVKAVLS
jgi:hypothetical protein